MTGLTTLTRDVAAGRPGDPGAAACLLLDPATPQAAVAGYLTAKAEHGATVDDVEALVRAVLTAAVRIPWHGEAGDVVGTGGDGSGSVNVSTLAALLAAGSGVRVAKAGNRAATSRCGSADLLDALGVPTALPPSRLADALQRHRFAFVLTSAVHPAVRRLAGLRRRLGFPTLFNLTGPLTNPVATGARLIGVAGDRDRWVIAEAASRLGMRRVWVVRSRDGMDEIGAGAPTDVLAVHDGGVHAFVLRPGELGLRGATRHELTGDDARTNAVIAQAVLAGRAPRGLMDTCALNAAALLALTAGVPDPAADLAGRLDEVRDAVATGATSRLLTTLTETKGD